MLKSMRVVSLVPVALGALLGYTAATGKIPSLLRADDQKTSAPGNGGKITGVAGSPSATLTIDGKQLPPPPLKFGGVSLTRHGRTRSAGICMVQTG